MIKWCAYCQEFQGEAQPYDNFALSHGMCLSCQKMGFDIFDEKIEFIQLLKRLQEKLWITGKNKDRESLEKLVKEAIGYNLRPVDVLVGLLAPLLYQIGEDWASGECTIAEEHRFTAFASDALSSIEEKMKLNGESVKNVGTRFLLVSADGNNHSLGVQIIEVFLRSAGIQSKVFFPGLPALEIAKLSQNLKPEWIGISVSRADQVPAVIQTVNEILKVQPAAEDKIILGGYAVKTGLVPSINGTIQTPELGSLVHLLRGL